MIACAFPFHLHELWLLAMAAPSLWVYLTSRSRGVRP